MQALPASLTWQGPREGGLKIVVVVLPLLIKTLTGKVKLRRSTTRFLGGGEGSSGNRLELRGNFVKAMWGR